MSRVLLKIAAAACIVALVACGVMTLGQTIMNGIRYPDADRYTAGPTSLNGAVKNLDIDWTEGFVSIAYHPQDTVEIAESAPKKISGDAALRWWLDGDTLRIRYAKSGFFTFFGLKKALTVTLPEGVALESVGIDATSADVKAQALAANDVRIDLTSGDIDLSQAGASERVRLSCSSGDIRAALADAKSVSAKATSGGIEISQTGAADSAELSTTSGDIRAAMADVGSMRVSATSGEIRATLGTADELSVGTTSGNIAVEGKGARQGSLGSTSGEIDVRLEAFDALQIQATSGDVTACLPSEPGYRAEVKTTSGDFDYTVALARDGGAYSCGDGSGSLRIHTTSGDVRLNDINQ